VTRNPAVAGQFYPAVRAKLEAELRAMTATDGRRESALAVMCPHAGYVYSGAIAGQVYSRVAIPPTVLILAPSHTGLGAEFALFPDGSWKTPLGEAQIDAELNALIVKNAPLVSEDALAHSREHSAEVQVPFLRPDVKIASIVIGSGDLKKLKELGSGIGKAISELGRPVLVVSSSDMTHYEPAKTAAEKDARAIEQILALDEDGLFEVVRENRITMCGVAPTVAMIACAKVLGAKKASLVKYANSGEVSGDFDEVVGYAGIIVT
jgi:AmmeMemoRadiSam system protein B